MKPILYTFRRCPYAIRARYALAYAGIAYEHREILLKDKPQEMLSISPKGTVPVLLLPYGKVLEESYDIMRWAVAQSDPEEWYGPENRDSVDQWVHRNDTEFKPILDGYKYPEGKERSQVEFRELGEKWLREINDTLSPFLLRAESLADTALFPFIRQFRGVDRDWFDATPYPNLHNWLQSYLQSQRFEQIMVKMPLFESSAEDL